LGRQARRALAARGTRDRVRDARVGDDLLADALRVRVDVGPAPGGGALDALLGHLLADPLLARARHGQLEGLLVVGVAVLVAQAVAFRPVFGGARLCALDEQGFEKFFADPPAALVVIKGLQKLAELKALPGRPLVAAGGAGESAAGEPGMKKAQIEANDHETQTAEPQEDRARNPIVGGEKRSQVREEDFFGHG